MSLPYDRFLFLVNKNEVATVKTFMKYCSCCHWSCIISYPIPNIAPNITLIANDNALPIFKEVVLGYLTRSTYKIFYFFYIVHILYRFLWKQVRQCQMRKHQILRTLIEKKTCFSHLARSILACIFSKINREEKDFNQVKDEGKWRGFIFYLLKIHH